MATIQEGIKISNIPPKMREDPTELVRSAMTKIDHKFLVMSGKGGVGKTSVSVNLARALEERNFRVGLVDIDIHGPDIPRMLGFDGMLDLDRSGKLLPFRFSNRLAAVSMESMIPNKDSAIIWRGPMKHSAILQFLGNVAWGPLDFLIIDAPPGTGDEPLTIARLLDDTRAIIVTTPQEISLADVRKSISFCRTVRMEIFGLIENMSGFTCPHCMEDVELFGTGGGERTAKQSGIRFLGRIPFDSGMVSCGDAGVSFRKLHGSAPAAKAISEIAAKLSVLAEKKSKKRQTDTPA